MTRSVLIAVVLIGCLIAVASEAFAAEQANFALAVGQWVTVGQYTLVFRGVTRELVPSYDLYVGSILAAHLPLAGVGPPSLTGYTFSDVMVVTTGVATDGTYATGTLTVGENASRSPDVLSGG